MLSPLAGDDLSVPIASDAIIPDVMKNREVPTELRVFCNALEVSYGATIYLRFVFDTSVMARSRVATLENPHYSLFESNRCCVARGHGHGRGMSSHLSPLELLGRGRDTTKSSSKSDT